MGRFSKKINDNNLNARISYRINSLNRLLSGKKRAQQLKSRSNYTQDDLNRAAKLAFEGKLTYKAASEKFGVPAATISNLVTGKTKSHVLGRRTAIPKFIEEAFVTILVRLSDVGVGLTKYEILTAMESYAAKNKDKVSFKNGTSGDKWYRGFQKRWASIISPRMAQNLPINRAKGVNAETAEHFYQIVHNKKSELESEFGVIPPTNWWNTDESGYCGDQGNNLIMCRKGYKKIFIYCSK